jgi:hypothetical protein
MEERDAFFSVRVKTGCCLLALSLATHTVIIRDDRPDAKYRASEIEFPGLMDLPGEGGGALIAPRGISSLE